jgi:AcrR family transcriptional regulator
MVEQGRSLKAPTPRKYELKKRAESVEDTHRRITEAAVELHGSLGPAKTTISGIAERAGVTRLTVYRHFPTLDAVFLACSARWAEDHPWPAPDSWAAIDYPDLRLQVALTELCAFYRQNQTMVSNLYRDIEAMPGFLQERLRSRGSVMVGALIQGRGVSGRARRMLEAVLGHAVEFETWRSLALRQGLSDSEIVELLRRIVAGVADDGV